MADEKQGEERRVEGSAADAVVVNLDGHEVTFPAEHPALAEVRAAVASDNKERLRMLASRLQKPILGMEDYEERPEQPGGTRTEGPAAA